MRPSRNTLSFQFKTKTNIILEKCWRIKILENLKCCIINDKKSQHQKSKELAFRTILTIRIKSN